MAHEHSVTDADSRFNIDKATREISTFSGDATIMQYDHNSERLTIELPKEIDGHDMTKCNVIQVHYINIDSATRESNAGVYEVDDMSVSPDDESRAVLSWLISGNATKYAGVLNFVIKFKCVTDGVVEYAWSTAIYKALTVSSGMDNGETVVEEYPDILAQWEARIAALERGETGSGGNAGEDSGQNPSEGTGWTTEQIDLLDQLFDHIHFNSSEGGAIADALIASLRSGDSGGSGEDSGDDSGETEKILTSISATYSGGDVAVGTAVSELTGIVVTAHYSDGTSETASGYTLSGEIVEGNNTVTVTYQGKTATFTVVGFAESEDDTHDGALYPLTNGTYTLDNGNILTITKGYHVRIDQKTTGLYEILDVNNTGEVAFTIPAGSNAILSVSNKTSAANPNEVFMNGSNVLPMGVNLNFSATLDTTNDIAVRNLKPKAFVSGVVAEYDVSLTVDGEVWI